MTLAHPTFGVGTRLSLTTLGGAALHVTHTDGTQELALEVGKPLALLAYLAILPGHAETRGQLINLLWTNLEPDEARPAVRQAVWQIRRKLGKDVLGTTNDHLTLLAPVDSDRDALLAAWERRDFEAVVTLYAGDFFPTFAAPGGAAFEQWADVERKRLRAIFVRAAESVVRQHLSAAHHREAQALARRVRDLDPINQDPINQAGWRLLLECLVASHYPVAAVIEADAMERLLAAEDIEPEAATRALIRLARTAAINATNGSGAKPSSGPLIELVGREREFSAILQAWEHAREGRFAHLHLAAPAGLGKTRLLEDVHARLRASSSRVVHVRADFGARDIAYAFAGNIAAALATRSGALGISPQAASALVALNPTLSASYTAAPDTATEDEALRHRVLAIRELIVTLTEDQPISLLLDDLHWSDTLSLRLLEAVLGALERTRVLVVSAARVSHEEMRATSRATQITLHPLTVESVATLLTNVAALPPESWAEQLPLALWNATRGSPLLVLETLQLLGERDLLARTSSRWSARDPHALFAALCEGSALRRRVEGLDPAERQILLLLAVGGVPLSTPRLAAAANRALPELSASLTALEQRGLIARRGHEWTTAHDEHASAMLDAASEDEVRSAAGAVGRAIADDAGSDPRQLRLAGPLLARGSDIVTLSRLFERFVRTARLAGDRRPNRILARELLGSAVTEELERSLVRSLPPLVRVRLVSPKRIAAAIAIVALTPLSVVAAVAAIRARPEPEPDVVLVAQRVADDHSTVELFDVPLEARRLESAYAIDVDLSRRPRWRLPRAASGVEGFGLRPDGRGWAVSRMVPDSGVLDIFAVNLDGSEQRLTFAPQDDYGAAWAPDNSRFVFITMRWATLGRYDLAIYDTLTRNVRQLTRGDDTDTSPTWSPDGSRIAFTRLYSPSGDYGWCVIDVDGGHLHCRSSALGRVNNTWEWADSHHVLVNIVRQQVNQLVRVDVESGEEEVVYPNGSSYNVSPDGKYVICLCSHRGYPAGSWLLFPVDRPNALTLLRPGGGGERTVNFDWAPTTPHRSFLDTLHIAGGPGAPALGSSYQVRATGVDTAGHPLDPAVVRWSTLDTSVATIDSSGLLRPRRVGHVAVEASAGGWRRARLDVAITESAPRPLLDELWTHGLAPTWIPFGDPKPEIVPSDRFGRAFLNNGDLAFWSGAYTAKPFETRGGVWVEAEISAPLTFDRLQNQLVSLFAFADPAWWASWDHRNGDYSYARQCYFFYPAGAGIHRGDSLEVVARSAGGITFPAPPIARKGHPFRALVQLFPDGRCGFALDGKPLYVSPPVYFDSGVRVILAGNSVQTRMLVGHLGVFSGIAPHVKWETVDSIADASASTRAAARRK